MLRRVDKAPVVGEKETDRCVQIVKTLKKHISIFPFLTASSLSTLIQQSPSLLEHLCRLLMGALKSNISVGNADLIPLDSI